MYYYAKNIVKFQTTLRSAVCPFSIRLYCKPSRWWIPTLNTVGNGPMRPKVQGLIKARDIHRKQHSVVDLFCYFSCPQQLSLSVMPGKPQKVCIVGSGNW
jgi:hypothetical protein